MYPNSSHIFKLNLHWKSHLSSLPQGSPRLPEQLLQLPIFQQQIVDLKDGRFELSSWPGYLWKKVIKTENLIEHIGMKNNYQGDHKSLNPSKQNILTGIKGQQIQKRKPNDCDWDFKLIVRFKLITNNLSFSLLNRSSNSC